MALLGGITSFLDKYILGYALGVAAGPALRPFVQDLANEAWTLNQDLPLAAGIAAAIAAEDVDKYGVMETEATLTGVSPSRFKDLYGVTLSAPGTGELLQALRRGTINPDDFTHGLRKAKFETRWDDALADLQHVRLTPQQLALGIVRSVVSDPGLLAVTLDTSGGVVPAYQQWSGDVLAEAKAGGVNPDRLRVMVGEIGLPMSAQQAASAYFRKIIKLGDYNRAILEGDTRPEWAPYILEQARSIPTPHQFVEGRLRGWLTDAQMNDGTARWGMTPEDTHLDFLISGRPLSWHQVFIGIRRGGVYDGPTDAIEPAFLKALQESNVRPEWYHIAWHLRFSYPTGFMVRGAVTSGDLTPQQGNDILYELGWNQKWIDIFVKAWSGSTTTAGKQLIKSELIAEFEGGFLSPSELRDHLTALGYSGPELELEIHLADARRIKSWRDKGITAVNKSFLNSAMTVDQAKAYLQDLGVTDPDTLTRITDIWVLERGLP